MPLIIRLNGILNCGMLRNLIIPGLRMNIGIPKEIKTNENRVSLVPAGAATLVSAEQTVILVTGAGLGLKYHAAESVIG